MQDVSAVLITRGDVDMRAINKSILPFVCEITCDDHCTSIYQRYLLAQKACGDLIYVQDDDCIVDVAELLKHYEPGKVLCNMPIKKRAEYPDGIALVGWGALFHPNAVKRAFHRYLYKFPADALFERTADRVFTGLNPLKLCDVPFEHLPHAYGQDRMGAQKTHLQDLAEIRQRIYACRA